jgi:hypothetical protein
MSLLPFTRRDPKMNPELNSLLSDLEQFGRENDARETDRQRKMLNLERDSAALTHILAAASTRHNILECPSPKVRSAVETIT